MPPETRKKPIKLFFKFPIKLEKSNPILSKKHF